MHQLIKSRGEWRAGSQLLKKYIGQAELVKKLKFSSWLKKMEHVKFSYLL